MAQNSNKKMVEQITDMEVEREYVMLMLIYTG